MNLFGVNGWELLVLIALAFALLGPDRMPEYAAKMAHGIRRLRVMAEGAKSDLKEQLGPEYEDLNWRQYDPRQYDPRRIVRDAFAEPLNAVNDSVRSATGAAAGVRDSAMAAAGAVGTAAAGASPTVRPAASAAQAPISSSAYDPQRPTPWDVDAT